LKKGKKKMSVKRENVFQRFFHSIGAVFIGLLLLLIGIFLPFHIEGTPNQANSAKKAIEYSATSPEGALVYTQGELNSTGQPLINEYVDGGDFLTLHANVEVYAWVYTHHEIKKDDLIGGGQTTSYYYTVAKAWTNFVKVGDPGDEIRSAPSGFSVDDNQISWQLYIDAHSASLSVEGAVINGLAISHTDISMLGLGVQPIDATLYADTYQGVFQDALYIDASPEEAILGSKRVKVTAAMSGQEGVAIGKLENNSLVKADAKKVTIFGTRHSSYIRFFAGVSTLAEAVKQLNAEHQTFLWIMRIVYLALFFLAISMILAPIEVIGSILPIIRELTRGVIFLITLIGSLILTIVFDLLAILANNILALIAAVVVIIIICFLVGRRKRIGKEKSA